ncbi:MAG: rRNA pseudouridine synthase [Erysipelotrichaceae bacterium]|nr:rRNA pseudouridine synthase [Erysipelotrichaceae bacterium]
MRLDKFLADMQVGTRSEVKKLIRQKAVTVDGTVAKDPGMNVSENSNITVNGEEVSYVRYEYFLLNKPQGYVCTRDYSPNVLQLIASRDKNLNPAGRLDKDTEGAILITNDGQLVHRLISPRGHVDKTYYVETDRNIPANAREIFSKPMHFVDFTSEPADYQPLDDRSGYLTVHEGKYHQVKRMFQQLGCEVTFLKRTVFASLTLEGLETGEYRPLSEDEINYLKSL